MNRGSFRCELVGHGANGTVAHARVAAAGDPGNRATTVMVCEAAIALANEIDRPTVSPTTGGILTPASALGAALAGRLRAAGMTLAVQA